MITVYSKDNCPNCKAAQKELEHRKLDFQVVKCPQDICRDDLLKLYPAAKSFPIIALPHVVIYDLASLVKLLDLADVGEGL